MKKHEDLVELISEMGVPPQGVDIETFAIAKINPSDLYGAARAESPSYEQLRSIKDRNPDLYRHITEDPQPERNLGESILIKQQRLSKTRRRVAAALVALTCASGMGAVTYNAKEEYRKDVPGVVSKENQWVTTVASGGIAGLAGGFATSLATLGFFSHRLARRPARKIVRKAEQASA